MKDGAAQQIAPPTEVYAQPANLSVARFMGYRNVLALDVVQRGRRARHAVAAPTSALTGMRKPPAGGTRAAVAFRPEEAVV